ncbi:MAG: hypothetical protein K0U24_07510 [Gammaproteobacteria bacterium]|nr:hypothetical protein [Gammaproteobacteria bacterium]MCH9764049.1 hypothetical protein [Gammaproteobacteria bacterium]
MGTVLDEINERNLQLKNAEKAKEKQERLERAEQEAKEEARITLEKKKAKDDLALAKQDFFTATSTLQHALNHKEAAIFSEHSDLSALLEDLIKQSTLMVDSPGINIQSSAMHFNKQENPDNLIRPPLMTERVQELTRIVHWATEAVNGTVSQDEALLKLLDKEINRETIFDRKGVRVLAYLACALFLTLPTAATVYWNYLLFNLTIEILACAAFLAPISIVLDVVALGFLAYMVAEVVLQIYEAVVAPPKSVGREVRALADIFELPELTQSNANDESPQVGFFTSTEDAKPEVHTEENQADAELAALGV